jgi:RNA polymerase sigma-70 factor (ECF subfamily)
VTGTTPGLEEKQAIARLKQGDLGGMEMLVKCYQVQAVYAAYLIGRDFKLAEDVVQAAFIHAAEKIAQFDENRPFKAWFLRSVVNAAIKAAERQKRFIPLDGELGEENAWMVGWLMDPAPGPEEVVETEETREMVWQALGRLAPEQRAAIILHHFLEMDETEMTHILHRPLTTVRWWLRTARKRLRRILPPFLKDNPKALDDRE